MTWTSIGNPDRASDLTAPALDRVNNEIDYALLSAPGEIESRSADSVVNIYQSHGIVQTGAHSIANLSVGFGEDEKRQVAEALDLARQSLDSQPDRNLPERGQSARSRGRSRSGDTGGAAEPRQAAWYALGNRGHSPDTRCVSCGA